MAPPQFSTLWWNWGSRSIPDDEALQFISKKLYNDHALSEHSILPAEAIMELLEVCLRTNYVQVDESFYQEKGGMAMGNSLPLVISNIHI